uniref:Sec-independent translocase component C n=1 Tax=Ochrosphaera neapolitana TaxID=35137 RepID=UPI00286D43E5|nr:Sec-independent translocase component C [Ochrosphaera neapolitana]WKK50070.1 Sec-independent translocase component C [Ochrosphaera neapolitana]
MLIKNGLANQFFEKYGLLPVRFETFTDDEMALSEHIEEFSQRLIFCLFGFVFFTLICFLNIKQIVKLFQAPALGIKFLQFAPGEYFFASVKIALFCGLLASSPFILYQIFLYVIPGMTRKERELVLPLVLGSGILFGIGLIFSYFFLVPAALNFFIAYGSEVVEPFWSFDQYFNFVSLLIFTTGLAFQVPVLQFILGFLGIISGKKMLSLWKYVVVIATIIAAIITPSTDPVTQILMASALLLLYLGGAGAVLLLDK